MSRVIADGLSASGAAVFATSAQGDLADSALQSKADIDALNIDAGTLDNLSSSQFARRDTNGTIVGRLNIGGADDGVNQLQVDGDTSLRGNVGVNTDDPTHALDVAGAVRVRNENPVFFGGAGASDAKFEMRYNAATQSLDFNYLG